MNLEALKFPIGSCKTDKNPSKETLLRSINDIETFPEKLKATLSNCTKTQLNWRYRPNGWTLKQVVHHCADSHLNSIIRFKLALTETTPSIRPYFEQRWAELPDGKDDDISDSLALITILHKKWVRLLKNLSEEQLQLEFIHPEHGKVFNLAETIGIYAWHCNHHLAHIKLGLEAKGKYD